MVNIDNELLKKFNNIGIGFIFNENESIIFFSNKKITKNCKSEISESGFISFNKLSVSFQDSRTYQITTISSDKYSEYNTSFNLEFKQGYFNFNILSEHKSDAKLGYVFEVISLEDFDPELSLNQFYMEFIKIFDDILLDRHLSLKKIEKNKREMFG